MDTTDRHAYPECEKVREVSNVSQKCGEFLEWLRTEKRLTLCETTDHPLQCFSPIYTSTQELLAEFFDIDLDKIEQERRAVLDILRKGKANG